MLFRMYIGGLYALESFVRIGYRGRRMGLFFFVGVLGGVGLAFIKSFLVVVSLVIFF